MSLFLRGIRRPGGEAVEVEHVPGGGGLSMKKGEVVLDNSQILTLPTTESSVEIVPALPDIMFFVLGMVGVLDNTAGVYSNVSPISGVSVHYGSGDRASTIGDAGWLMTDGSKVGVFLASLFASASTDNGSIRAQSDYIDQFVENRLEIRADNDTLGDFEGGHESNTLKISVFYTEVHVS